jgi:hypothetical protein
VAAQSVHDRDGVQENVQGSRSRPQRKHEAQRHDVHASAGEDLVESRSNQLVDCRGCQRLRREVEDPVLEHFDLSDLVLGREVADGAGEAEDQWRERQDGEEGGLRRQARHAVLEAGRRRAGGESPGKRS